MDGRITVCLTGPAKIGRDWLKAGDTPSVTLDEARQLKEAGLLSGDDLTAVADLAPGMPGYDEAVQAMAKTLADAAVNEAVQKAEVLLIEERDAALERANAADARVKDLEDQIAALEAKSAAPASDAKANPKGPPADTAKAANKSGAAKKS
jgi:hypothetical protein